MTDPATRWTLADGRDLLFFALPGHTPAPVPTCARCRSAETQSQLRFDRQTGQWVIVAALRQDRTYKPPPEACPLCPGPSGLASEIPAPDYDVVVFENRFPSLSHAGSGPFHLRRQRRSVLVRAGPRPMRGDLLLQRPHRLVRQLEPSTRDWSSTRGGTAPPI